MKIVITGHTAGLGKILYEHFQTFDDYEVIGISRSTGYNLTTDLDKIIEEAAGCYLFINNASVDDAQLMLLENLHNKVNKMIVMGSIAGEYDKLIQSKYSASKKQLEERCKELSLIPNNQILYLKISMLEDAVSSDNLIPFADIVSSINFWLTTSRITRMDFEFKLTAYTLEKVKEKFNAKQEAIDYIINNMCNSNRQQFND
jgi:short-subunit dehydrogenase